MSIKYCDFTNGDDTTGDGSAGNPYKTIDKASTGLTGGDEVRCAKSPANTALTGTLTFTENSTSITGSGTAFTTELVVGDFVQGGDGYWYEVTAIASDTALTIFRIYPSTTQAGVSSYKLGYTDTGTAAASGTKIQNVSASGTSLASKLTISGGWNLSTTTQDGHTAFYQSGANRYGYGIYGTLKNYLIFSKITMCRYNIGIILQSSNGLEYQDLDCYSCNGRGLYISSNCDDFTVNNCNVISCNTANVAGIQLNSVGNRYTVTNNNVLGCAGWGYYFYTIGGATFSNCVGNHNNYGFYTSQDTSQIIIDSCTFNDNDYGARFRYADYIELNNSTLDGNTTAIWCQIMNAVFLYNTSVTNNTTAFYMDSAYLYVNDSTISGNTNDFGLYTNTTVSELPLLYIQNYNKTANDNRTYYATGTAKLNTADARSNSCQEMTPTNDTYYIRQSFYYRAVSGTAQTLSAYIKMSATFNGDVQMGIFFNGKEITSYADVTPSVVVTYEQKTAVAAAIDITQDGVLELRIKCRGTLGSIFLDDLNTA